MQILNGTINFGSFEGSGPRSSSTTVTFPAAVTQATAVMTGFRAAFSPSEGDHHLGNIDIRLSATVSGTSVAVNATFGLRDWSGEWDDKYEGAVFFSVVAD